MFVEKLCRWRVILCLWRERERERQTYRRIEKKERKSERTLKFIIIRLDDNNKDDTGREERNLFSNRKEKIFHRSQKKNFTFSFFFKAAVVN